MPPALLPQHKCWSARKNPPMRRQTHDPHAVIPAQVLERPEKYADVEASP
jgi:hypothetical protein